MISANRKETTYASDRVPTACERLGQTTVVVAMLPSKSLQALAREWKRAISYLNVAAGKDCSLGAAPRGKSMAGAGSNTKYDAFAGEHIGPTVKMQP